MPEVSSGGRYCPVLGVGPDLAPSQRPLPLYAPLTPTPLEDMRWTVHTGYTSDGIEQMCHTGTCV